MVTFPFYSGVQKQGLFQKGDKTRGISNFSCCEEDYGGGGGGLLIAVRHGVCTSLVISEGENHGSQLRAFSRQHSTQPLLRRQGSDRNKLHGARSLFKFLLLKI